MSENTEVAAVPQGQNTALATAMSAEELKTIAVDFNGGYLPSLKKARTVAIPLDIPYWSPVDGETKDCWILGVDFADVPDITTGEMKSLECVFLVEENESGERKRLMNGSKPLVGKIKSAISRGEIIPKTLRGAVEITFFGLKKNKRNNFKSHDWQIMPKAF